MIQYNALKYNISVCGSRSAKQRTNDANARRPYYHDQATGRSSWEPPRQ